MKSLGKLKEHTQIFIEKPNEPYRKNDMFNEKPKETSGNQYSQ